MPDLFVEEFSFIFLSSFALIINKYVLSTLHFTLPTVFQGWQTLVCVTILTILLRLNRYRLDIEKLERKKLAAAFIPMAFFTVSQVAGSKALADLPVAVFVAGGNVIPASLSLCQSRKPGNHTKTSGSFALMTTVILIHLLCENRSTGWLWLCIHIISLTIHTLTLEPLRINAVTSMYYCNFFSAVILIPLSVYLQEAHSAMNVAKNARIEFYVGCVLSGIFGTFVQILLSGRLTARPHVTFYQGVGKILACTLSLICFPDDLDPMVWWLVVTNLILGCFLFIPDEVIEGNKLNEACVV